MHDIAHAVDPSVKVVYVDLDPVVCIHGRALLAGENVAMVQGDVRKPHEILAELRPYFRIVSRHFFPLRVPAVFCNLVIGLTLEPRPVAAARQAA